jgi:hypothetical protein
MPNIDAQLKVGAHVLVQLGAELVTDVEQAILECVKNAYDADSLHPKACFSRALSCSPPSVLYRHGSAREISRLWEDDFRQLERDRLF